MKLGYMYYRSAAAVDQLTLTRTVMAMTLPLPGMILFTVSVFKLISDVRFHSNLLRNFFVNSLNFRPFSAFSSFQLLCRPTACSRPMINAIMPALGKCVFLALLTCQSGRANAMAFPSVCASVRASVCLLLLVRENRSRCDFENGHAYCLGMCLVILRRNSRCGTNWIFYEFFCAILGGSA